MGLSSMKQATSKSYNFLQNPHCDIVSGDKFLGATIAVIDGCRKTNTQCDRAELNFLQLGGLLDYEVKASYCQDCLKHRVDGQNHSICEHGFFCAAIIASRLMKNATLGSISLGHLRGLSPPPRISLYGVGCPCESIDVPSVCEAICSAVKSKVTVISLSLVPDLSTCKSRKDYHQYKYLDELTLGAFKEGILTVVPAGNNGESYLQSVSISPPWCLSVGACSSSIMYRSTIIFSSDLPSFLEEPIQGSAIGIYGMIRALKIRKIGKIVGLPCKMYVDGEEVLVEACGEILDFPTYPPEVYITRKDATRISLMIDRVLNENGLLYAQITSSSQYEVSDPPRLASFSGVGPCDLYKPFMKPEICAPGKQIAASWPSDVPVGIDNYLDGFNFNVISGSSFAVPHVAAAVARVMTVNGFSASAAFSAAITTATKMHGKDLVGREHSYGAGMLNMHQMMRPGAVYEERPENFERWNDGRLSHYKLNLPYFSTLFPCDRGTWKCRFDRFLTSKEVGGGTFHALVEVHYSSLTLQGKELESCFDVTPRKLVFAKKDETLSFCVNICLPDRLLLDNNLYGLISASLKWIKETEKEVVVDSPILLSSEEVPHDKGREEASTKKFRFPELLV